MNHALPIRIKAGTEALALLRKEGFDKSLVRGVAAAAGGPKWFTTFGLMKYILGDLLPKDQEVHLIGASVGSWQMTAGATDDPGASLEVLRRGYAEHIYSEQPDATEISQACRSFIKKMITPQIHQIINHPYRHLHIITAYGSNGLNADSKLLLGATLASGFVGNIFHRRWNYPFAHRVVWSNQDRLPYDIQKDVLPTTQARLTTDNLLDTMQASGAIPFMMDRVRDIHGGPKGSYWDGGLTDYQISLPYQVQNPGIILHPHFSEHVLAGWFDKKLPWTRRALPSNMSKVLLIHPTDDYIRSLPRHQISDMKDFYHFGDNQQARIDYWREISSRSHELAEALHELIETDRIVDHIEAY